MGKTIKKVMALILAAGMLVSAAGCGNSTQSESKKETETQQASQESQSSVRTVVDAEGNKIELPDEVTAVAPGVNSMSQITAMLGDADKIVAAGKNIMGNDFFKKVFPDFNPQHTNDNIEEVLASGAQVVYSPMKDDNEVAQYNAAGVAYVHLPSFDNTENFMEVIKLIGDILGEDASAEADEFIDYFYDTIAFIHEKTDSVPQEEKIRAIALGNKEGAYSSGTSSNMQNSYLLEAGAVLRGDEYEDSINVEEILAFDPQVIFCVREVKDAIMSDEDLQEVSAIKEGRVYIVPFGTFGWGVNNAEAAGMAPLYYAKCIYPDLFQDVDMIKKTQEFYKQFYDYDLPEDEAQGILDGTLGNLSGSKR